MAKTECRNPIVKPEATEGLSRRQLLSGGLAIAGTVASRDLALSGNNVQGATITRGSAGKFSVRLVEEKEVVKDWWYPHLALFCRERTIFLPVNSIPSQARKGEGKEYFFRVALLYSTDGGTTWLKKEEAEVQWTNKDGVTLHRAEPIIMASPEQLSSGLIIQVGGNILDDLVRPKQAYRPWVSVVRRAQTPNDLLKGNHIDDYSKIEVPNLGMILGDSPYPTTGNACKVVELENGDLLLPMEGRFNDDTVRVPYHTWEAYQFRTWVCRSTDGGRSWHYLSTVASSAQFPLPPMSEGYCEPHLITTAGQSLLAVMRTGGNPSGNGSVERYTDLMGSISRDGGVFWEPPKRIYKYGVCPKLLKMSTGTVVCSSGRPGVFLLFSRDDGDTWSEPYVVAESHGKWPDCPSGYTSIGETEPGVLCLFYDDTYRNEKGELSHGVKMHKYTVN